MFSWMENVLGFTAQLLLIELDTQTGKDGGLRMIEESGHIE